jgi:DNA-binding MarR family transcriptional regulator
LTDLVAPTRRSGPSNRASSSRSGRGAASEPPVGDRPTDASALAAAKEVNVGHFLLRAARLWNEEAISRIRAGGFPTVRISHTQVMPHLDLEGTRLTELARRMDVTKQAAQELINELEQLGVVERVPDPSDGRAKLIRFSAQGRRALFQGLDVLAAIEGELRRELGDRTMSELSGALGKALGVLETLAVQRAALTPVDEASEPEEPSPTPPPRKRGR